MIDFIVDKFYYLFLGLIVLSLVQRHRGRGNSKRTATIFQAILVFIIYIGAMVIKEENLEKKWIIVPLAIVAAVLYFFRSRIIPYKMHCRNCGAKLNAAQIFMHDSNLCSNCDPDDKPEEEDESEDTEEDNPGNLPDAENSEREELEASPEEEQTGEDKKKQES